MKSNLAVIGCGAIAQLFYLPAMAKLRGHFGNIWLVDPSYQALSRAHSIIAAGTATRLADIPDDIQLVIVATPNHLHFPVTMEALSRGADVLIEKPFVIWPEEGRRIVKAAAEKGRAIAINQTRRYFPLANALRRQISGGEFGPLKAIVHREGTKMAWPYESGAAFAPGAQRTGVVMDFGVHVIDFYHYVLGPQWEFVSATHDGFHGPESLAEIDLKANGAPVSIRLSRYHEQENVARLFFERAAVSFNVYDSGTYSIQWTLGPSESIAANGHSTLEYCQLAEKVILDFAASSERREPAVCNAASALPVIELLDQVYTFADFYPASLGAA